MKEREDDTHVTVTDIQVKEREFYK